MKFYSVQMGGFVEVPRNNVEIVTMKNGRKAAHVKIQRGGKELQLFKILTQIELRTIL